MYSHVVIGNVLYVKYLMLPLFGDVKHQLPGNCSTNPLTVSFFHSIHSIIKRFGFFYMNPLQRNQQVSLAHAQNAKNWIGEFIWSTIN